MSEAKRIMKMCIFKCRGYDDGLVVPISIAQDNLCNPEEFLIGLYVLDAATLRDIRREAFEGGFYVCCNRSVNDLDESHFKEFLTEQEKKDSEG